MTSNKLHAQLLTVGQLFEGKGCEVGKDVYTIPIYQRNFAWGAEQIEQLISDVQDALQDSDDGYFLGNLIVTERETSGTQNSLQDFEVIDGQQRLTTLSLLWAHLGMNSTHPQQSPVQYESRPRSAAALARVTSETSAGDVLNLNPASGEDAAILEAYNVIQQFLDQHSELREETSRTRFADYLRNNVTVVRASLPPQTDLNRYFEIMNTRGKQLQQIDIVKAKLMSHLPDGVHRGCFAWVWDACADMDSYVQMSLTRGNTGLRDDLFSGRGHQSHRWSWLTATGFDDLRAGFSQRGNDGPETTPGAKRGEPRSTSLTLDEALAKYASSTEPTLGEDENNVRFRSTIEFPAFLLHVLKVVTEDSDDDEQEAQLDDKRLIRRFHEALNITQAKGPGEAGRWVSRFAFELLRYRNLFDGFILKRQYTPTSLDTGEWSLQQIRKGSTETLGYRYTFSTGGPGSGSESPADVEEDGDVDVTTREVLLIQSVLRVTYTSPRTMHWITRLLAFLGEIEPTQVTGAQIVGILRDYARGKVREAFFSGEEPTGFHINRIVFNYLDYLFLSDQPQELLSGLSREGRRFRFRNSIEHYYPQHPAGDQIGPRVTDKCLDLFGNLALVSVDANSRFGNSLPGTKAREFPKTIAKQGPKLQLMARIAAKDGWDDDQVRKHHGQMVALLRKDVIPSAGSDDAQ